MFPDCSELLSIVRYCEVTGEIRLFFVRKYVGLCCRAIVDMLLELVGRVLFDMSGSQLSVLEMWVYNIEKYSQGVVDPLFEHTLRWM